MQEAMTHLCLLSDYLIVFHCNNTTKDNYNDCYLSPNGILGSNQKWYSQVYSVY